MYEEVVVNGTVVSIRRLSDGALIPLDENNRDYQEYLNDG